MTDAGHEVVPKVREVLARVKSKTRRGIDDNDYDHLLGMLGIVLRNLTEKEETEE